MLRQKFSIGIAIFMAAILALATPFAFAEPANQAKLTLNIGVIGPFDGPTAEGVTLALQRFSAQGPFTTPDGATYTLAVITANATTPQGVSDAITQLKRQNAVALFGPDDDKLFQDSLPALQAAGIPVFTSATATTIKGSGLVFRIRAADNWRMIALANYMTTDLGKTHFAVYQGSGNFVGPVAELVAALTQLGKPPSPVVTAPANAKVDASVKTLMDAAPDAIIAFGTEPETSELYRTLRGKNYKGVFATPNATLPGFIGAIPESLRAGIYGVTGWSYAASDTDSADLLRDYVAEFGNMPTELSASAYDSAVALAIAIQKGGLTPEGIHTTLLKLPKTKSLEGFFNPALANNDLTASVSIIVTNVYGAPSLVARYEDTGRVAISSTVPTPYPTATFTSTPVPQGIGGTMNTKVNVRSGPGENFEIIGQLNKGEQQQFIGASADFKWYVINFRQTQGWIPASAVTTFGDVRSLPVVQSPPTPTPSMTPIATAIPIATGVTTVVGATQQQFADIIFVSSQMNPPAVQSGQPFTLTVTIKNQGSVNAGPFAVATTFMPGNDYSAVNVDGLAAGATMSVNLPGNVTGSGSYTVDVILDLNNQVNEGPDGEANNKIPITYTVNP